MDANTRIGEKNLMLLLSENGTYHFIGCSGQIFIGAIGVKVYATDCSELKITNTVGAKTYRNGFAIGSIYQCDEDNDPAECFGGKWERCSAGRVLVGFNGNDADFGTIQKTGGAKTHSHSLNSGYAKISFNNPTGTTEIDNDELIIDTWTPTEGRKLSGSSDPTSKTSRYATRLGGYSESEKSLNPYYVVNMWRRVQAEGQE